MIIFTVEERQSRHPKPATDDEMHVLEEENVGVSSQLTSHTAENVKESLANIMYVDEIDTFCKILHKKKEKIIVPKI